MAFMVVQPRCAMEIVRTVFDVSRALEAHTSDPAAYLHQRRQVDALAHAIDRKAFIDILIWASPMPARFQSAKYLSKSRLDRFLISRAGKVLINRLIWYSYEVTVAALWLACFALTYTFPILNEQLGPAITFWIYAAICLAGFVYIWFRLPETKGQTLEQIERELVDRR